MQTEPRSRAAPRCDTCSRFHDDPRELERTFAGITALSSAYGSTRGCAGLCEVDGSFRDPTAGCSEYRAREVEGDA